MRLIKELALDIAVGFVFAAGSLLAVFALTALATSFAKGH